MSRRLFPFTCTVRRTVEVGTNGRTQKQDVATGVRCNIIPMATRYEIDLGFSMGLGYDAYFPDPTADVQVGDELVWEGSRYQVRSASSYIAGRVSHRHALVTREGVA